MGARETEDNLRYHYIDNFQFQLTARLEIRSETITGTVCCSLRRIIVRPLSFEWGCKIVFEVEWNI